MNPAREILTGRCHHSGGIGGQNTQASGSRKQQEYGSKLIGYEAGWVDASEVLANFRTIANWQTCGHTIQLGR